MKRLAAVLVVVLVLACVVFWALRDKRAYQCFEKLPPGWSVKSSEVISPEQTEAIGEKLGTPILKLSNTLLVVQGTPIQVNILDVKTEADAVQLHRTISKTKEHPAFCLRIGKRVIEYVGNDPALATKVSYELGFLKPNQSRDRVRAQISTADECFEKLPPGWSVKSSKVIPSQQTEAIALKLGTPILKLSNTLLVVQGTPIQVNIIDARTEADAIQLHKTLSAMHRHPAFCLRIGERVIEYVGNDPALATKVSYELGFLKKHKQIRYRVTAQISTIDKADYMSLNTLSQLLVSADRQNPSEEAVAEIASRSKRFQFGSSLTMRSPHLGKSEAVYAFSPGPRGKQIAQDGAVTYLFENPSKMFGVPYVRATMEIWTDDTGYVATTRKADESLLAPTEFWPSDDPEIIALARKITTGKRTTEDKVQAILEWLGPGKNIRFGGGVTGSRWGVKKVLDQKCGRCWDFSDCFVTLCRAAGIPCRQVAGWLYGVSGHIWAEVLVEGEGWQQVDPTGGGNLQCGICHIPYFTTETGEMPILYVSMPSIEIAATE